MLPVRALLQTKLTPSAECAVRYFTRKPHVLAGCSWLAQTNYMDRHNDARKVLFFEMLRDLKLADSVWPWYSWVEPKPLYELEDAQAYWDVPV